MVRTERWCVCRRKGKWLDKSEDNEQWLAYRNGRRLVDDHDVAVFEENSGWLGSHGRLVAGHDHKEQWRKENWYGEKRLNEMGRN